MLNHRDSRAVWESRARDDGAPHDAPFRDLHAVSLPCSTLIARPRRDAPLRIVLALHELE